MINNKKNIFFIKKIILLLILLFFSNLFYLYFKTNYKESFVIAGESDPTNTVNFLSYKPSDSSSYKQLTSANDKIDNLTTGALYALGKIKNDDAKNFSTDMGDVQKFPINDIVKNKIAGQSASDASDASAPENLYDENDLKSLVLGYGIIDKNVYPYKNGVVIPRKIRDIRIDTEPNIYLDNYDQIDKIIEREKLDDNYTEKTLKEYNPANANQPTDKEVYKMRNQDDESKVNRRGAVEVAYSRKEELNETKNKHKLTNTRYNSINLQYIFLIGIIVISIIVLGLYYISSISNLMLIIYIILVIFVIYFFNIINIVF